MAAPGEPVTTGLIIVAISLKLSAVHRPSCQLRMTVAMDFMACLLTAGRKPDFSFPSRSRAGLRRKVNPRKVNSVTG